MESLEAIARCAAAACGAPFAAVACIDVTGAVRIKAGAADIDAQFAQRALAHGGVFVEDNAGGFRAGVALPSEDGSVAALLAAEAPTAIQLNDAQRRMLLDLGRAAWGLLRAARRLEQLQSALDDATDCVAINEFLSGDTLDVRLVYVNAFALQRTGFTRDELIARGGDVLSGPLTDRAALDALRADVKRGITRQFELPVYCKDGSYFWTEARWQPLYDEDGSVRRYLSICRDITERRESVRALTVLTRAVDEATDLVLVTDSEPPSRGGPYMLYANRQFLDATGYTAAEIAGQSYSLIMAENNDPATMQSIIQNLEELKDCEKEILLRRKDGSSFWVEFASRPLSFTDEGKPAHWVAVGRDITARRQTQAQMAALVNAIDASSDHLEIYVLENGAYVPAFQNAASDPDASLFAETVLNEQPLRERLLRGETVTLSADGLLFRPLGANAETVICVRRQPAPFAAAS